MLINEDPERKQLQARVRVLEMALREALEGLRNSTSLTMGERRDLILKLEAIEAMR